MVYHVGSKLQITTSDGEYIGVLHSLGKNNSRLTLNSVTSLDTGKSFHGLLNFYSQEILKVIVLEEKKPDNSPGNNYDGGQSHLKAKVEHPNIFQQKEGILSNYASSGALSEEEKHENKRVSADIQNCQRNNGTSSRQRAEQEVESLPEIRYTLINSYNEAFNEAIIRIKKQAVIGLSAVAVDMGRNGCLSWLAMATNEETFLFDIIQLGDVCFSRGLSSILQSGSIQKVVHDCRRLSDLLYHKYNTELVNVFDTQVAYVMIYRNKTGQYPRYVEPLANLLHTTLNLDSSMIHFPKIRMSCALDDQLIWCQRPAPEKMLRAVAKDVMHLIKLRVELLRLMLADFIQGVDIYLCCIRDIEDDEILSSQMVSQHMLPTEFTKLQPNKSISSHRSKPGCDKNGFRENLVKGHIPFKQNRNIQGEHKQDRGDSPLEGGNVNDCHSVEVHRKNLQVMPPAQSDTMSHCDKGLFSTKSLSSSLQPITRHTENSHSGSSSLTTSLVAAGNEVFYNQKKKSLPETLKTTLSVAKPLCDKNITFSCIPESVNRFMKQDMTDTVRATQTYKGWANRGCSSESETPDINSPTSCSPQQTSIRSASVTDASDNNEPQYTRQHSDNFNIIKSSLTKTSLVGVSDGAKSVYSLDQFSSSDRESVTGFKGSAKQMDNSQKGNMKQEGNVSFGRGRLLIDGKPDTRTSNPGWSNSEGMTLNTGNHLNLGQGKLSLGDGTYHSTKNENCLGDAICIGRGRLIPRDSINHSTMN